MRISSDMFNLTLLLAIVHDSLPSRSDRVVTLNNTVLSVCCCISPDLRPRLLTPFFRAGTSTTRFSIEELAQSLILVVTAFGGL